jgi:ATP-dependent DNA ligase
LTRIENLPKRKAEFIEPMECTLVPALPQSSGWTYEVKLDGYRAIGVKTSDFRRSPRRSMIYPLTLLWTAKS